MAAVRPSLGRLHPGSTILFLCDMQEKFRHVAYFPQIVSVAARMLKVQPEWGQTSLLPQVRGPPAPALRPWGPVPSQLRLLSPPQVARLLDMPVVVTEQYPQGLGPTVPELGAEGLRAVPKTCFSMVPAVRQELDSRPQLCSVLLCGLETQACILVSPVDCRAAPSSRPSRPGIPFVNQGGLALGGGAPW